jgi:hypothetical protein
VAADGFGHAPMIAPIRNGGEAATGWGVRAEIMLLQRLELRCEPRSNRNILIFIGGNVSLGE